MFPKLLGLVVWYSNKLELTGNINLQLLSESIKSILGISGFISAALYITINVPIGTHDQKRLSENLTAPEATPVEVVMPFEKKPLLSSIIQPLRSRQLALHVWLAVGITNNSTYSSLPVPVIPWETSFMIRVWENKYAPVE